MFFREILKKYKTRWECLFYYLFTNMNLIIFLIFAYLIGRESLGIVLMCISLITSDV